MAKNTCGTAKLQASGLHEALLDHHKTHILQIVSILILLIQNVAFSSLNFFQQLRILFSKVKETQKIGLAANFERWKKIGQNSIIFQKFYHKKHIFRTTVMKLLDCMFFRMLNLIMLSI